MSKYIAKIGLEMHCEISKTKSKVFSGARNDYSPLANSNVRPLDMGFPGVLPVVNKEAVRLSLMASMILNCKQPEYMYFERKNYYYPDLPKGYQITQETKPIPVGIYGNVKFDFNGEERTVRINNIHLEEDSASLDHLYDTSVIDYNRSGVPLLELVTEPDITSADEAVAFLEHMRSIYRYAGISDADSKKGQIRCDVNVSIMDSSLDTEDPNNWGTKIEIKNVNSFGGVRDAINYEIDRQIKLKEDGTYDEMEQQTRRWDEDSATTIYMRSKVDAIDYKYFVDPNIPKFKISKEWLEGIRNSIPKLAYERKKQYLNEFGLSEYDTNILIKDKDISDYFEECISINTDPKQAANWINGMVLSYLNANDITIDELKLRPNDLKELIDLIESKTISSKQGKDVFNICVENGKSPKVVVKEEGMLQITDPEEVRKIVLDTMNSNLEQVNNYKTNPRVLDFFIGQVMKNSRGKANPEITRKVLSEELEKTL
mgnify:FL=1